MSFYIRKSIKFGPLRLNFSKSGIGISAGVKGARISTGPRGTYINMGRNGIYYRQKIDGSITDLYPESQDNGPHPTKSTHEGVPTTEAADLIEKSNKDLLDQINSRIQQPTYANSVKSVSIAIAIILGVFSLLFQSIPILFILLFILAILILFAGLEIASVTAKQEKLAQITTLQYNLEKGAKDNFSKLQIALDDLAKSGCIWRVTSRTSTWDWKRNAGATSLINRIRVRSGKLSPPFIQTRIMVFGLLLDSMQLFFLPDQVFVFQNGRYGAVSYSSLKIYETPTRFIEEEGVPGDAQIVDHTWRYPRKDGGPDMRFSNNRQVPIAQYSYIELLSHTGLEVHLHVSNLFYAQQFTQALSNYIQYYQSPNAGSYYSKAFSSTDHRYQDQNKKETRKESIPPDEESPYTVLKISPNATWEEISTAYRKMVQMYHPDKVASLAPEYKDIAEKRMRSINAAYEQLERKFNK